jgi:hypothetical protein
VRFSLGRLRCDLDVKILEAVDDEINTNFVVTYR